MKRRRGFPFVDAAFWIVAVGLLIPVLFKAVSELIEKLAYLRISQ